jgi:SPP1 gp7 family putative phage head morphogenesis protein
MNKNNNIPTIKDSAQSRLLLYRLLSLNLTDAENQLLNAHPTLWDLVLSRLEELIETEIQAKSEEITLKQAFVHIERITKEGLQRQIERLTGQSIWLGVFPQGLLDSFIEEHRKLIKSVRREHLEKIALTIKRGIREGLLEKDIAKEIRKVTDISKRRSRLIARNVPLQYSGALTKHHQMSAGIKQYRWQSSHDERVRTSHRKHDGKVFNWSSPGPYPRSEINCRCDAVPCLPNENNLTHSAIRSSK